MPAIASTIFTWLAVMAGISDPGTKNATPIKAFCAAVL
jgi:hypothetical protein